MAEFDGPSHEGRDRPRFDKEGYFIDRLADHVPFGRLNDIIGRTTERGFRNDYLNEITGPLFRADIAATPTTSEELRADALEGLRDPETGLASTHTWTEYIEEPGSLAEIYGADPVEPEVITAFKELPGAAELDGIAGRVKGFADFGDSREEIVGLALNLNDAEIDATRIVRGPESADRLARRTERLRNRYNPE